MPSFKAFGAIVALTLAAIASAHPFTVVDGEVFMRCEVVDGGSASGGNGGSSGGGNGGSSSGGNGGSSSGGNGGSSSGGNSGSSSGGSGGSTSGGNTGSGSGGSGGSSSGGNTGSGSGGNSGSGNGGNSWSSAVGGSWTSSSVIEEWTSTASAVESWATTETYVYGTTVTWANSDVVSSAVPTASGASGSPSEVIFPVVPTVTASSGASTITESSTVTLVSTLPPSTVVASATSVVESAASAVPTSDCGCESLSDILVGVSVQILPLCNELTYLTSANITIEIVTQITTELTTVIGIAIDQVTGLHTSPLDLIFGLLDITVVSNLIGSLLVIVFTSLGAVITLCASADVQINVDICLSLLANVGISITALIKAILDLSVLGELTGSIISVVVGLVVDVSYIIKALGLVDLSVCLGLPL